jgi:alkylhydroperoxidase family enzyme
VDINTAVSRKRGVADSKLDALAHYADHPAFTERERAALAWAEMVTISPNDITDEMFAETRKHFSEREIVELSVQAALENFRARVNRALRIEDDGWAKVAVKELPKAF